MRERVLWSPGRAQLALQITLPSEGVPGEPGPRAEIRGWGENGEAVEKPTSIVDQRSQPWSKYLKSRCSSIRSRRSWRRGAHLEVLGARAGAAIRRPSVVRTAGSETRAELENTKSHTMRKSNERIHNVLWKRRLERGTETSVT